MDTKKQLRLAWIVAGVLAIALLAMTALWITTKRDLDAALDKGGRDLISQRDKVQTLCKGADAAQNEKCLQALDDLENILRRFSKDIRTATSSGMTGQ